MHLVPLHMIVKTTNQHPTEYQFSTIHTVPLYSLLPAAYLHGPKATVLVRMPRLYDDRFATVLSDRPDYLCWSPPLPNPCSLRKIWYVSRGVDREYFSPAYKFRHVL